MGNYFLKYKISYFLYSVLVHQQMIRIGGMSMTKMIRTPLDVKFEKALKKALDEFGKINQEAVKLGEDDVKYASCYIYEILDGFLTNIEDSKKRGKP